MNILYTASEAVPFIKTGGLADVAGSYPRALKSNNNDVRVVLPMYKSIKNKYFESMEKIAEFHVDLGWRKQYVGVMTMEYEGVIHYFLDNEYYFDRDGIYGYFDDGERFTWFSKAVTLLGKFIDFKPDVIHTNDWHTALVNLYVKDFALGDSWFDDIKTVFTIHNLKYQGVFDPEMLGDIMGVSENYFHEDGIKFYNQINFLKGGIVYSDAFTTVSENYAQEIKTQYFGEQLDGIIRKHEGKLSGIVNGIDYEEFNPGKDKNIFKNYDLRSVKRKKENKIGLQKKFGLPEDSDIPMVSMVTRLVDMKGLDLVAHIFEELMQEDIQFVVLGTGDKRYEDMFKYFSHKYPQKVYAGLYFNEQEAHGIYAASDIFLMPSKFEPCGISQLIAMRYGTIPVVRSVGGLKDTVIPYNYETEEGTGFTFENYNAHDMLFKIKEALALYNDNAKWNNLIKKAMKSKTDWNESSKKYVKLYKSIVKK
ncbi:glycogen synthase GlgA [Alkalibacter mobilis]|uniref:glycogen synthase GlgA n=1 Tax=Alkalibacter mobilis TaxID=2787712 RepID=UPI00189DF1C3|nr:glycogen synthase GlgA [Alkalibacter mobilis]MBF7095745.1 glycogen synthase GlgA [Alkalibacter mobilis]